MSLFKVDPIVAELMPATMYPAFRLATKILRSDFHTDKFCSLFSTVDQKPHIDRETLTKLLSEDEIFLIDKIRFTECLDTCLTAIHDCDSWRIYFNPQLLLEMKDREREEQELKETPFEEWPDLITPYNPWKYTNKSLRNYRTHNSLVYSRQKQIAAETKAAAKRTASRSRESESIANKTQTKQEVHGPALKKRKSVDNEVLVPSGLSVAVKNTQMLTYLLVHAAEQLLTRLLSAVVEGPDFLIPKKRYSPEEEEPFDNVGHLMERSLHAFCIQHAYDEFSPSLFCINEIIGTKLQRSGKKSILKPNPALLAILANPTDEIIDNLTITADLLRLEATSAAAFVQNTTYAVNDKSIVKPFRASYFSSSPEALARKTVRADNKEEEEEEEEELEEDEEEVDLLMSGRHGSVYRRP